MDRFAAMLILLGGIVVRCYLRVAKVGGGSRHHQALEHSMECDACRQILLLCTHPFVVFATNARSRPNCLLIASQINADNKQNNTELGFDVTCSICCGSDHMFVPGQFALFLVSVHGVRGIGCSSRARI